MSETQSTDYDELAEQYQELADALDEIVDQLCFIAEHEQTDELQAERAEHMKIAIRDIQRNENWSHHAHNLSQAAYYEDYGD
jgi:hypothetical protein